MNNRIGDARRIPAQGIFLLASVVAVLFVMGAAAPAGAEDLDFCNLEDKNCKAGGAFNAASVTVTKVAITQQENAEKGCVELKKVRKKNLAGGVGLVGTIADATFNIKCVYHVRFSTTAGCVGDKDARIRPTHFMSGASYAKLKGGCGTLHTTVTFRDGGY